MKNSWVCAPLIGLVLLAAGCASEGEKKWGVYQEPTAPRQLPVARGAAEIKVLWKKDLGDGAAQGYAILQPAYGAQSAAILTGEPPGLYAVSRDGKVYKLNADNGATIWRRDLGTNIFSGVGVGESRLAVATDSGMIIALDADSGAQLWAAELNRQISAIPALGGGRVVARTADGLAVGLNAADGEIAWSFERAVPDLSIHGDAAPRISGDAVIFGLANGKFIANNLVTGREYWETEVSFAEGRNELERLTDSDAAPLILSNIVYTATYRGHVAALRLTDAAVLWKTEVSSRLPMSLGGGKLAVTTELGEVLAIDAESGDIVWRQEGFRGRGMSRPLVRGNRVILGDAGGNLYSLDLTDGALLERRKAVSGAVVALIPGEAQFAVFSANGELAAAALRAENN